jgi:hypothetical protein
VTFQISVANPFIHKDTFKSLERTIVAILKIEVDLDHGIGEAIVTAPTASFKMPTPERSHLFPEEFATTENKFRVRLKAGKDELEVLAEARQDVSDFGYPFSEDLPPHVLQGDRICCPAEVVMVRTFQAVPDGGVPLKRIYTLRRNRQHPHWSRVDQMEAFKTQTEDRGIEFRVRYM